MVVVAAGGQIENLLARSGYLPIIGAIAEPHHRVGVGDIELVAEKPHAKRLIEVCRERLAYLGTAIAVGIAKQCDPIRRRAESTDALEAFEQRRRDLSRQLFRS